VPKGRAEHAHQDAIRAQVQEQVRRVRAHAERVQQEQVLLRPHDEGLRYRVVEYAAEAVHG